MTRVPGFGVLALGQLQAAWRLGSGKVAASLGRKHGEAPRGEGRRDRHDLLEQPCRSAGARWRQFVWEISRAKGHPCQITRAHRFACAHLHPRSRAEHISLSQLVLSHSLLRPNLTTCIIACQFCTAECTCPRMRVHREAVFQHGGDQSAQKLEAPSYTLVLGQTPEQSTPNTKTRPDKGRGRPLAMERPNERRTAVQ